MRDSTDWTVRGDPGPRALAAVAAAAVLLRLWHLGWGLPALYEEATPLFKAWGFWNWDGHGLDFNPRFFNYPAFSILVQFILQSAHLGIGIAAGVYPDANAFHLAWSTDFARFVLIGRLPGVVCDTGTVVVTGLLAGRLISRRAGLFAAVMAAVNPLQVRLSQMIAVDSILAFFTAIALLVMIGLAQAGGWKKGMLAGVFVGLAASTKYTGAVLLAPLVLATVMGHRMDGRRSFGSLASAIVLPVLGACVVFVAVNPYVILDSQAFLRDFGFEQTHMAAGHFGVPAGSSTPLFYFMEALPGALGWVALALGLPGIVLGGRNWDRGWLVASLGFGALLLMPMVWAMRAERYILPALPGVILLFVGGMEWLLRGLSGPGKKRPGGTWAMLSVLGIVIASYLQPAVATAKHHRSLLEPDTRADAADWISRHLPPGSAIVLTPAGINVDSSYVQLPIPYLAVGLEGIAAVYDARWYTDMDLLVGSDFDRARYLREPGRYGAFLRFFYDSLDARWRKVWTAEPGPTRQGPGVWLYVPPRERSRTPFPADLTARLETMTSSRVLTVFAANLASVLDARGRSDRARQVRTSALVQLLRRFPADAPASIAFLSSMARDSTAVLAIADSLSRSE